MWTPSWARRRVTESPDDLDGGSAAPMSGSPLRGQPDLRRRPRCPAGATWQGRGGRAAGRRHDAPPAFSQPGGTGPAAELRNPRTTLTAGAQLLSQVARCAGNLTYDVGYVAPQGLGGKGAAARRLIAGMTRRLREIDVLRRIRWQRVSRARNPGPNQGPLCGLSAFPLRPPRPASGRGPSASHNPRTAWPQNGQSLLHQLRLPSTLAPVR